MRESSKCMSMMMRSKLRLSAAWAASSRLCAKASSQPCRMACSLESASPSATRIDFFIGEAVMVAPHDGVPLWTTDDPAGLAPAERGLRTEGLHHRLVGLDVRAADQVDAIRHGGENAVEGLLDRLWLPRQVDDQAAFADHRELPREDRRGHELQAHGAH